MGDLFLLHGQPLTNKEAYVFLDAYMRSYFSDFTKNYDIKCAVGYKACRAIDCPCAIGGGRTIISADDSLCVTHVGVGSYLEFESESDADELADAGNIVSTMVAIHHERQHVQQLLRDISENKKYGSDFALDIGLRVGNAELYDFNQVALPSEVDAQGVAVYGVYQDLVPIVGRQDADLFIMRYQYEHFNMQRDDDILCHMPDRKHDYLGVASMRGLSRPEDLFKQYSKRFEETVHVPLVYDLRFHKDLDTGRVYFDSPLTERVYNWDKLARYLINNEGAYGAFCVQADGREQRRLAAACSLWNKPDAAALKAKLIEFGLSMDVPGEPVTGYKPAGPLKQLKNVVVPPKDSYSVQTRYQDAADGHSSSDSVARAMEAVRRVRQSDGRQQDLEF